MPVSAAPVKQTADRVASSRVSVEYRCRSIAVTVRHIVHAPTEREFTFVWHWHVAYFDIVVTGSVQPQRFDLMLQLDSAVEGETMADVDDIVLGAVNDEHDGTNTMDLVYRWKRIATPRSFGVRKCDAHA